MLIVKVTNNTGAIDSQIPAGGSGYFALNHAIKLNVDANGTIISTNGTGTTTFTAADGFLIQYGSLTDGGFFRAVLSS